MIIDNPYGVSRVISPFVEMTKSYTLNQKKSQIPFIRIWDYIFIIISKKIKLFYSKQRSFP